MRLLHVTATHLNLPSGISTVLRDLVNAQNGVNGFEARVLSLKADVSSIGSPYFDFLGEQLFDEYIGSYCPNVVIFHNHFYFEYLKCYKTLIKLKIPYFIEPHGAFGQLALNKSKYKKLVANRFILDSFMKNATGYIFLNECEKRDSKYRSTCDLVIPNGINAAEIVEDDTPKGDWSFYFIGRYDIHHKGLDFLFDALDILEQKGECVRVSFYGTGSQEGISYINNRIKEYKALHITNCGPVYGDTQKNLLEKHGIMILTSRYEGFPMTVLEAWRYGNPCLVTQGTNVMDEVVSEGLGWGTDLHSESIAKTLLQAQEDYFSRQEDYIQRCKSYVRNTYSWDQIARVSYDRLLEICDFGEKS